MNKEYRVAEEKVTLLGGQTDQDGIQTESEQKSEDDTAKSEFSAIFAGDCRDRTC